MPEETKSVLDGVPVKITEDTKDALCKRTFCRKPEEAEKKIAGIVGNRMLEVVGHCPSCGAPIYGTKLVAVKDEPEVKYSCNCWRRQGVVSQKMEHEVK